MGRLRCAGVPRWPAAAVIGFALVLGGMVGSGGIRSYDIWWHLRLGQDIIRTHTIALHDVYSHSATGSFRPPQQWLFEVAQGAVYNGCGDGGMVGLRMVLSMLVLGSLAALLLRRRVAYLPVVAVLVLVASASMPAITCRPHLTMPLFLLALVSILDELAERPSLKWIVVALFALWANVHASMTVGLAVVGAWGVHQCLGAPDELGAGIRFSTEGLRRAAWVFAAAIVGSLVNPVGPALITYSLSYLPGGSVAWATAQVTEWNSTALGSVETAAATVLLIGGPLVMLARWRRVSLFHVLLVAMMAVMGLRWVRGVMPSSIMIAWATLPVLSAWLAEVSPTLIGWNGASERRPDRLAPSVLLAVIVVGMLTMVRPVIAKRALDVDIFPERTVAWVLAHDLVGNMYNPYDWGGYLIHRLYPRHRVFIDGRADMYGEDVYNDWRAIDDADAGWENVADRYGVEWGIARDDHQGIALAVEHSGTWAVVKRGNNALVFVRRDGPNGHLTAGSTGPDRE